MLKYGYKLLVVVFAYFFATTCSFGSDCTSNCHAVVGKLLHAIYVVRTSDSPKARRSAAENLDELTTELAPYKTDDKALAELISLLDMTNDSVRFWVAASLGNLGAQARSAIPKLEETLAKVDCLNGSITSAAAIRHALTRLGVTHPRRPRCGRIAG